MSSPNAELEKTICTNSLYGAAMCSKISTSLYNSATHKNLIDDGGGRGGVGDDDDDAEDQPDSSGQNSCSSISTSTSNGGRKVVVDVGVDSSCEGPQLLMDGCDTATSATHKQGEFQ